MGIGVRRKGPILDLTFDDYCILIICIDLLRKERGRVSVMMKIVIDFGRERGESAWLDCLASVSCLQETRPFSFVTMSLFLIVLEITDS